jgi:hypothetical protein
LNLPLIQEKWFDKFSELQGFVEPDRLAAPFISIREQGFIRSNHRTILLVGKATAGPWCKEEFLSNSDRPLTERMQERRGATRCHLEKMHKYPSSAFWRFWTELHQFSSSVIWTNLAKIGVVSGNPVGDCLEMQSQLAIETLHAEIEEYRPRLIVITGEYATNEILYQIWPKNDWEGARHPEYCWIRKTSSGPSVLWVDHPERKRKERIRLWIEKVCEFL